MVSIENILAGHTATYSRDYAEFHCHNVLPLLQMQSGELMRNSPRKPKPPNAPSTTPTFPVTLLLLPPLHTPYKPLYINHIQAFVSYPYAVPFLQNKGGYFGIASFIFNQRITKIFLEIKKKF